MTTPNMLPPWLLPIKRRANWSSRASDALTKLRSLPPPVRLAFALTLLMLLTVCAGCATISTPPDSLPRNPEPPPSRLPSSPPNYLTDAQRDISEWQRQLNALTRKPAN